VDSNPVPSGLREPSCGLMHYGRMWGLLMDDDLLQFLREEWAARSESQDEGEFMLFVKIFVEMLGLED